MSLNATPSTESHFLHHTDCIWPESNCYTDLWVELLHRQGHDPLPLLGYCITMDFLGDQWTFFKPPFQDLKTLYGIEVVELTPYRPLINHLHTHTRLGHVVLMEVDGYHLPDTAGTSYHTSHEKTTIGVDHITADSLTYYHGRGHHHLPSGDFHAMFETLAAGLPPYLELVRFPADRCGVAMDQVRRALLQHHITALPGQNPFVKFQHFVQHELNAMMETEPTHFHGMAFATIRQFGSAAQYSASYFQAYPETSATEIASLYREISELGKTMMLRMARQIQGKKPLQVEVQLEALIKLWDRLHSQLLCLKP